MFREKVTAGLDSRLDAQEELLELVLQNLRWPLISTEGELGGPMTNDNHPIHPNYPIHI